MTVDIPEQVWRTLEKIAADQKTQISTVVRQALDRLVDRWHRKIETQAHGRE